MRKATWIKSHTEGENLVNKMMSMYMNFIANKKILRTWRTYYYNPHKMHLMAVNYKHWVTVIEYAGSILQEKSMQSAVKTLTRQLWLPYLLAVCPQAVYIISQSASLLKCEMRMMPHKTPVYICIYRYFVD